MRIKVYYVDNDFNVFLAPQGFRKAWIVKSFGDTINYDTVAKVLLKTNNAVVSIKSLIWPGLTIAVFVRKYFTLFSNILGKYLPKYLCWLWLQS